MMYLAPAFATLVIPIAATLYWVFGRKLHPLSFPFLAAGSFAFLYLWDPLYLIANRKLEVFLSDDQIALGVAVAGAAYVLLLLGWRLGGRKSRSTHSIYAWDYGRLYVSGIFLVVLGLGLFLAFINQSGGIDVFYSMPHGAAGRWEQQTAWVYLGPYLVFPGLTCIVLAVSRREGSRLRWLPFALVVAAMLVHATLSASRGTLFPTVVSATLPGYLARGRKPAPRTVVLGGIALLLALLLLVGFRGALVLAEDRQHVELMEALAAVTDISEAGVRSGSTGNEFVYHTALIDGVQRTGKLAYGLNWLYTVTVHPIPRILWPEKPYNWYTGLTWEDLYQTHGFVIASGATSGAVADFWAQFGVVSLGMWVLLGWVSRRMFDSAISGSTLGIIVYVSWYCWALQLFGQGFSAVLVPFLYSSLPTLALTLWSRRRRVGGGLWTRQSTVEMTLNTGGEGRDHA